MLAIVIDVKDMLKDILELIVTWLHMFIPNSDLSPYFGMQLFDSIDKTKC